MSFGALLARCATRTTKPSRTATMHLKIWVSPPGIISNYQPRRLFKVSGINEHQQALDEAGQMRATEDPVVRIIQLQRAPED